MSSGGARKGAGRKSGRTVITRSVSMPPAEWEQLDRERGEHSRGKFIAGLLKP
jgi:hypothetical protein